ncbi:MAG: hypothetical protein C0595_13295 [Marinilabiliales bacterium]|nr:MAG: hypothetical protein C0595_13295 [Marinilabiliales bacterium]
MKKVIILILIINWLISSSFVMKEELDFPAKRVNREIKRFWKDKIVDIKEIKKGIYLLENENDTLGFLYVGRVNSCRQGGCSIDGNQEELPFEYFDYFLIIDKDIQLKKVKIFNYQATHGHEVMSSGWLRQFRGYNGKEELKYGRDIEAISGATISAKALNDDVKYTLNQLQKILISN